MLVQQCWKMLLWRFRLGGAHKKVTGRVEGCLMSIIGQYISGSEVEMNCSCSCIILIKEQN